MQCEMQVLASIFTLFISSVAWAEPAALTPVFDGKDASRKHIAIGLTQVASGFDEPTDVQFLPDDPGTMLVLEQAGALKWVSLKNHASGTLMSLSVNHPSEMGLLGLAFHPQFHTNRKFYLDYTPAGSRKFTRISEWTMSAPGAQLSAANERVLFEVDQPYGNHKAGGLVFGPDHYLYIGFGDGGSAGDPQGNGQNKNALLGKMLRLDVDRRPNAVPEIFALGLRNPWRFTFDPRGRLIVADVGQDRYEEIDIVEKGRNYGWNVTEGYHCFKPEVGCSKAGLTDPIYEYGRDDGGSIIGGFVYTGKRIPALQGKYLFSDWLSGRIWAADLPPSVDGKAAVYALGRWTPTASTFGQDADGEIYLGDYSKGVIYRLDPAQ